MGLEATTQGVSGEYSPEANLTFRGEQRSVEGGRESPFEERESFPLQYSTCTDSDLSSERVWFETHHPLHAITKRLTR